MSTQNRDADQVPDFLLVVELALASVLVLAKAAMAWDIEPFEQAGWNSQADDGRFGCDKDFLGLPL